jgi:hypothetical protein
MNKALGPDLVGSKEPPPCKALGTLSPLTKRG